MTLPNNSHLTTTSLHLASSYLLPGRIRVRPQLRACSVQVKRRSSCMPRTWKQRKAGRADGRRSGPEFRLRAGRGSPIDWICLVCPPHDWISRSAKLRRHNRLVIILPGAKKKNSPLGDALGRVTACKTNARLQRNAALGPGTRREVAA